ncbi:hypothetical protein DVH24_018685 [Malus domestica]|uniref:Uncharacterized protein n=1 Tax=Malus domestica TaxID=3750 RepID=A0A498HKT2_MALDO|nr:hypothetical protein DVH24_018685 [Malus domestica]
MPSVFSWLQALIHFLCSGKSLLPMLATCLSSLIYSLREYSTQLPPFFSLWWFSDLGISLSSSFLLSLRLCLPLFRSLYLFRLIPIRSFADGFCVYAWILLFFFTQTSCPTFDCYRQKHHELRRHTNTIIFIRKELQTRKGFVRYQMVRDAYDDWYGSTLYELQSALGQIEKKKGKALYTMNNMSFTKAKRRSSIFHIPNTVLSNNYTLKKEKRNHKVNNQVAASTNRFCKDPMFCDAWDPRPLSSFFAPPSSPHLANLHPSSGTTIPNQPFISSIVHRFTAEKLKPHPCQVSITAATGSPRPHLSALLLQKFDLFKSAITVEVSSLINLLIHSLFPLLTMPIEFNYRACTIPYRFPFNNPRKPTPTELSWINLFYNSTPSFK